MARKSIWRGESVVGGISPRYGKVGSLTPLGWATALLGREVHLFTPG